jgi:hypothetical protein
MCHQHSAKITFFLFAVLVFEHIASFFLVRHSTTWVTPPPSLPPE